jgi:hypothetical protein
MACSGCDNIPGWKIRARSIMSVSCKASLSNISLTRRSHEIHVGFPSKDTEQVQDVKKEILIDGRHGTDQSLVLFNGIVRILSIHIAELVISTGNETLVFVIQN